MIKANIDEKTGEIYSDDGEYICSLGQLMDGGNGGTPATCGDDDDDDDPRSFHPNAGLSETLIRRQTNFDLPDSKEKIQKGLWTLFGSSAIHQVMSNISNPQQFKRAYELSHASITASLADNEIAEEMSCVDYIQSHIWARNLISRASTFEGDRLRDATILGRQINPTMIDALRYTPDTKKSGGGGFFGFLKR